MDVVLAIRELRADRNPLKVIAEKFEMSVDRVSRITTGRTYADFPGPITFDHEFPTCRNGHPRTPKNTYIAPVSRKKECKMCLRRGAAPGSGNWPDPA